MRSLLGSMVLLCLEVAIVDFGTVNVPYGVDLPAGAEGIHRGASGVSFYPVVYFCVAHGGYCRVVTSTV